MKISIVSDEEGEWTVLYFDGVKILENHSLRVEDVLEAMGVNFETAIYSGEEYFNGTVRLEDMKISHLAEYNKDR